MISATEAGQISAMNYKTELDKLRHSFTLAVKTAAEMGETKAYFNSTASQAAKTELLQDIQALGYRTGGWKSGASANFHDIIVYWGE
jgi:hypothetical protein